MDLQIIEAAIQNAFQQHGLTSTNDSALVFYNLDQLDEKIRELQLLFPENSLHAIAIKANPLTAVLRKINTPGTGLEAASLPELYLALNAGLPPKNIVFDSPVKTKEEIAFALKNNVHLNADNLDEITRIESSKKTIDSISNIGLRINPQVGTGRIKITSVGGEYSKFGVPLNEQKAEIIDAYLKHDWLTGIHVHVGSQGCELTLLVKGVKKVFNLANEINHRLETINAPHRIRTFDLGGGLPVAYRATDRPPGMKDYYKLLKKEIPGLFEGRYHIITEFGRCMHVNNGFTLSRVEYLKRGKAIDTAMIHLGADMFIRECYLPNEWSHELLVADQYGKIKTGPPFGNYMLAGPLCFQGDIVARNVKLPRIEQGDFIVIRDTGAYTLSMWSRYNSRQIPKVIGFRNSGKSFEILKEREKPEDLWKFWS